MHLCLDWTTTALAHVPEVSELLTSVVARSDKIFAEPTIHLPAPALAAARTLHVGVLRRIIIRSLLLFIERHVVVADKPLRQRCWNVVRVRWHLSNVGILLEPIQLLSVTGFVHWRTTRALQLRVGRHELYRVLKLHRALHVAVLAEVVEASCEVCVIWTFGARDLCTYRPKRQCSHEGNHQSGCPRASEWVVQHCSPPKGGLTPLNMVNTIGPL